MFTPTYSFGADPKSKLRVATFNVSMESGNYKAVQMDKNGAGVLARLLEEGTNTQIQQVAEIIQRVRPDVILLNEFDFIENTQAGIEAFNRQFLARQLSPGVAPILYPYFYVAPVNTGEPSPFDFNKDGEASGRGEDAWGYGQYPGHYGMAVLSRYPIVASEARSLRLFKWADMPGALAPVDPSTGLPWYSKEQWQAFRLSSKSIWDLPIDVGGERVHLLASHPTPPVFDGEENRNGLRNHDELRLLADYISGQRYIYDDNNSRKAFAGERFVIVGDLNASQHSAETYPGAIEQLLHHPRVNSAFVPVSVGGKVNAPESKDAAEHTALWRSRADYVLPSKEGFTVLGGEVFWPEPDSPLHSLVATREASSDHRLVYLDLKIEPLP